MKDKPGLRFAVGDQAVVRDNTGRVGTDRPATIVKVGRRLVTARVGDKYSWDVQFDGATGCYAKEDYRGMYHLYEPREIEHEQARRELTRAVARLHDYAARLTTVQLRDLAEYIDNHLVD